MPHVVENPAPKLSLEEFRESHGPQLISSGVPEIFWPILHEKLTNEVFDAGNIFKILCYMDDDDNVQWKVVTGGEISCQDPNQIYLIDHAWTYQVKEARLQLQMVPGLMDRMAALMRVDTELEKEQIIDNILTEMWKYNQTYSFGHFDRGTDESMPFWYIMDEFGSRIQHSSSPSFRTIPFYYAPLRISFTLLFPVQDVEEGGEVTRNYVEGASDTVLQQCRLLPWEPCDLKSIKYKQTEPDLSFFESHRQEETLPVAITEYPGLPKDRNVKVYFSYQNFPQFLTDGRFEVVDTEEEADIIWISQHFDDYKKLSEETPGKHINEFPSECVVTVKDMLAVVSRRAGSDVEDPDTMETEPSWLPTTYNLQTELPAFVSYFQHREEKGLDNHWICKPWNLARGLDMTITSDLNTIVRLPDSGPKIACKYVEDPVLFYRDDVEGGVKFDVRYMLLLSSVQPLKLYVHRVFWLRFANKAFSLDNFDDYEKHFTVMNYVEGGKNLKQINYYEFIPMFDDMYPQYKWSEVEEKIFQMFRELFEAASSKPSPAGIAPSPQSRAMYAVDLLLKWKTNKQGEKTIEPVICEVNFSPDCARGCKYYPDFVNDIFSALFLDDIEGRPVTLL